MRTIVIIRMGLLPLNENNCHYSHGVVTPTQVLLVLAGASNEPAPIRDTVTKTLADFKKTHLDTWAQTRAAFSEEQWDAFMDLSLSPSYFV
eukprot:507482-Prorocentrum_minimum.AAC.1